MNENLSKAMRSGFYYQAIFIEYAITRQELIKVLSNKLKSININYEKRSKEK